MLKHATLTTNIREWSNLKPKFLTVNSQVEIKWVFDFQTKNMVFYNFPRPNLSYWEQLLPKQQQFNNQAPQNSAMPNTPLKS